MQTTAKALRASKPKAPTIPALMPLPSPVTDRVIFRATYALNNDACEQALLELQKPLYKTPGVGNYTKRIAVMAALQHAQQETHNAFENCREGGGLLLAWRGSRALVQALPASLNGGAQ